MQPLQTNRRILVWLWLCSESETRNKFKKLLSISFTFIVVASITFGLISSANYLWRFLSIDLQGSLFALYQSAGFLSILYAFVVMFISRHKIDAIFDDLTQIYRDSEFLVIFIQNFKNYFKEPSWTIKIKIKIKIWKKWAKKFQVKILFYDFFLFNDAKLNEKFRCIRG